MKLFSRDPIAEVMETKTAPPQLQLNLATMNLPSGMTMPEYGDVVSLVVTFEVTQESIEKTYDGKQDRRRVVLTPISAVPVIPKGVTP